MPDLDKISFDPFLAKHYHPNVGVIIFSDCGLTWTKQAISILRLLTHVGFFRQNGLILSETFLYMERSKNLEKKFITVQKNSPS